MLAERNTTMDNHRRYQTVLWGLVASAYCVSLLLIAGPFRPEPDMHLTTYKVGHVAAFAVLGLLVSYYFRREFRFSVILGVTLTLLACALFGALVELYQYLIPGRSPELRDLTLDSLGAIVGALAYGAHQITARGTDAATTGNSLDIVESALELLERR